MLHEFSKNAELRTEDSEGVNVVGQRQTGIASTTPPWFQKAFGTSTIHSAVIWIKFIKPDVAAVDVSWEMTGGRCPDGSDDAKQQTLSEGARIAGNDKAARPLAGCRVSHHGLAGDTSGEHTARDPLPDQ